MTKLKTKKLAAIALSTCMAACVGGAVVGFLNTNHASTAYAATAKYAVTENYSATVTQGTPATVNLTESAGQYIITAKITEVDGEPIDDFNWEFYDLVATVNGESVYLSYNIGNHTFTGVIRVGNMDTLELSTFTTSKLTLSVSLGELYIGQGNDYNLSGVQIPAKSSVTLKLDEVSGEYKVLVDLGMVELEEGAALLVQVGNGARVPLTKNTNYYSAWSSDELDFDGATSVTIYSTSSIDLTAYISLLEVAHYDQLPMDADNPATLDQWMPVTYAYTAAKTGYQALKYTSSKATDELSITFKTDAESFEGLNVTGKDVPLYMEEGNTYYFEVTFMSEGSTEIYFDVLDWDAPLITADVVYPVPVTPNTVTPVELKLNAAAATYNLSIQNIPFDYYYADVTITAHIGAQTIELTPYNNYSEKVTLTGETSIYLTTSQSQRAVLNLYLETPEVREYLTLGEATAVTVPAGETVLYYIAADEAEAGYYNITLSNTNGALISVTSVEQEKEIIPAGELAGGFAIRYASGDYALEFTNNGSTNAHFDVTVSRTDENVVLNLATANKVELTANMRKAYYLENLAAGSYKFNVSGTYTDLTITVDGEELALENGVATLTISEAQDDNGLVTVIFKSATTTTLNVTITPTDVMKEGVVQEITAIGYYSYSAYYINLEAGTYVMTLDLPEGMAVTINANDDYAVFYGNVAGTFTVAESGYVTLRFHCYNYGESSTFKAYVSKVSGMMAVGTVTNIGLSVNDFTKSYTLNNLIAGEYSINLNNATDVKVAVNGVLVENGMFKLTDAYMTNVTITFIYSGDSEITVNATVNAVTFYTMELEEEKTITLDGYNAMTYYFEGYEGTFEINLDGTGLNVMVIVNGNIVIDGTTSGTFTLEEDTIVTIMFINNSYNEVTFGATIIEAE